VNITAISVSRLHLPSRSRLAGRLPDFVSLMKPRVMLLAVFTALVGLVIAPGHLDPLLGSIAILAIATGAGAAGVLNMWHDADIDAVMTRTAGRPIPRGRISRAEALAFGLVLACGAVAVLALALNVKAAALLAFTIFFYVVVYTVWLKRYTPQNIVIGGAAGALPPVIGWTAATGNIGLEPLVLFLIIFLWTPPHFWALSLNRADGRGRKSRNNAADPHLHRSIAADFAAPLGTRLCRRNLRRGCRHLWSAARRARVATAQGRRGGSASRSPFVCILHCLSVCAVRGAVGQR
jgi:protoheme IX farnesyltransferase